MSPGDATSNHERIKNAQRRASQELGNRKPSQVTEVYWLYAERRMGNYPQPTSKSGKWLLFIPNDEIDTVWGGVKQATESGKLGGSSKVSTARPNRNAVDPAKAVICVYTYHSSDERDVMRARE